MIPLQAATGGMSLRQLTQHAHERHGWPWGASRTTKRHTLEGMRAWHRNDHGCGADHAHERGDNG